MNEAAPIVNVKNVTKRYGRRVVIDVDEFSICSQAKLLFLGENGCGKSTLFRLLVGASRLTTGNIIWSAGGAGLRLGYMPQAGGLYDDFTLRQNLRLYASLYGRADNVPGGANPIIDRSMLAGLLDVKTGEFSGGTRQLATLACVLSIEPNALVLDEPFGQLDVAHEGLVYDVLSELSQDLRFLLVSSHGDTQRVPFDRRVVMKDGRIVS